MTSTKTYPYLKAVQPISYSLSKFKGLGLLFVFSTLSWPKRPSKRSFKHFLQENCFQFQSSLPVKMNTIKTASPSNLAKK